MPANGRRDLIRSLKVKGKTVCSHTFAAVGIVARQQAAWFRLDSRQVQVIVLFFQTSKPTRQPNLPLIRWVPAALFPQIKRPGRETNHSFTVIRLRISAAFPLYAFMTWTGTALPLLYL